MTARALTSHRCTPRSAGRKKKNKHRNRPLSLFHSRLKLTCNTSHSSLSAAVTVWHLGNITRACRMRVSECARARVRVLEFASTLLLPQHLHTFHLVSSTECLRFFYLFIYSVFLRRWVQPRERRALRHYCSQALRTGCRPHRSLLGFWSAGWTRRLEGRGLPHNRLRGQHDHYSLHPSQ